MTLDKIEIQNKFNNASKLYESVANIQKLSAEILVNKLLNFDKNFYPKTILDLGSGTGYLPEILLKHYPKSQYTLNDIAPNMIEQCQSKFHSYTNFQFSIGDMENIELSDHQLIISNLAMQWVNNIKDVIQKFLTKSNILAFSCLLDGTFIEWQQVLNNYYKEEISFKRYPTANDLKMFCNQLGINDSNSYFFSSDFHLRFDNVLLFIKYLRNLGANVTIQNIPIKALKALISEYQKELNITYKVFFIILRNKK